MGGYVLGLVARAIQCKAHFEHRLCRPLPRVALKKQPRREQPINIDIIKAILESAQEAWMAGSIDGVLDKYVDDPVYIANTGPKGELLTIRGKEGLRRRFTAAMEVLDSRVRFESIRVENGLVRTRMTARLEHRATGHNMTCTLRQILRFEDFRIAEQQDFHDAPKMAAFWKLVGDPLAPLRNPVSA